MAARRTPTAPWLDAASDTFIGAIFVAPALKYAYGSRDMGRALTGRSISAGRLRRFRSACDLRNGSNEV